MSKKQYLVEKLAQLTELKQKAFNPTHSSLRKVVTQLMLVVMLWQALVQPAVIFASSGTDNINRGETKTTKEATKNTSVTTSPKPVLQGPGEVVITRHAPSINGSRIEGTVRVLLGENINVNSNAVVTGDLLVPGSPTIRLNGNVNYNGTVEGTGNPQPTNYAINLNSNVSLRHVVTRTDATQIEPIANPPQPTGTRDVALNRGQDPGDFATIRNLIVNSGYGQLLIPQGTYGAFSANSSSGFTFGVAGQSTVYNLQSLTLNSNSKLEILGSVTINIQGNVSLSSQTTMGDINSPALLSLNISQGSLTLNSNSTLSGVVKAPNGQVSLNANSILKGLLTCDRLVANSNSKIQGLITDVVNPVVTITEPQNGAVFNQAQVTVSGTVEDESVVTVKVNNIKANFNGSTFSVVIPLNLGSNVLTAVATDAFNNMGQAQVTVSRTDGSNQAPVVDAGPDLNANLSDTITLNATVNDDGKPNPPGQLTITWTKESGPGNVTFSSPNTAVTNVIFSAVGSYVLKLSATDSQLSSSDTVTITVTNNQPNQAPVVNAGQDATVTLPAAASLNGSVTDDGLPSNQLTIMWSKQTGPGSVIFANAQSAQTTATFSEIGVYTLRLSASDGELTTSDEVLISVAAPTANFSLMAAPTSVTTVQNTTATYMINVISSDPNFRNLIGLSVSGVPGTARATFEPQQVVAGSSSTLTIDLNNGGVTPGTYNLTITGTTPIGSMNETHSIPITLIVQAATQTTLSGRVLSTEDEPLSGVTVSIDGQSATTDAAGAFLLSGVLAGNQRAVMVDGRTASNPGTTYPVIAEPVDVIANQPNQMPYTFYLPRIDTQFEVSIVPNQDTIVTTPRVNNLQTLIPAGANLRNRDGSPVTRVSMTPVPIDRTPAPLPSNLGAMIVFTNQPGGAIADVAMPVTYPNLAGAAPDTLLDLYTFNHDLVEWEKYGVGKVSADGRSIVPEIDPATNKPYGLRDFSWHFATSLTGNLSPASCPLPKRERIDLGTGIKVEQNTDISFGGARGGLSLSRVYTSDLDLTGTNGYFGKGTKSNWEIKLTGTFAQGGAGKIIWPEQVSARPGIEGGIQFNFTNTQADGSQVFTSSQYSEVLGDTIKKMSNGTYQYRFKNGDIMNFDSNGRLTSMVDRNSNTTSLSYTGNNLTSVTDAVGRSITMSYDGQGRIISATDPIGRNWTYSYSPNGHLASVTDPLNNSMTYSYISNGGMQSIRDKRNNVINTVTYSADGRVSSQTFADGGVESYNYTITGGRVTSARVTDPENRITSYRFNSLGYVFVSIDGLGQPSIINRDINTNLPTQVIGPCGCPEELKTYNSKGDIITVTDRLGQIMRYEYDPVFSFVTKITDKNGHITRFTYDNKGNRTSVINAKNEVTSFAYDLFGQRTSVTDALNHTWSVDYDPQGNITSKTDPLNHTWTMTYDGIGRKLSMSDPLGRTSSVIYDAMDRVISRTDSANATTASTYDQNGNQTAITNALNNTWFMQYDSKNRMINKRFPLTPTDNGIQRQIRMEYNLNDELTAKISPSDRTIRYAYDFRGQTKTVTDPLGGILSYNYDIDRNVVSFFDQRNNVMAFDYDELHRVVKITDPLGKITSKTYDSENNVTSMTDRLGRSTTIIYDELNRFIRVNYPDAIVNYQYDAAGRKVRVDDTQFGGTFISWNYDSANRLVSETTSQGSINYTYDLKGDRLSMAALDRPVVNYTYDTSGRIFSISQNLGQETETFTYAYDILSRRIKLERPNGVTTTYNYDEVNRLVRQKHQNESGEIVEDFNYTYTNDDEIASINSAYSLTQLPTEKTNGAADATNRISNSNGTSYSFDLVGQPTSKVDMSGTTQYEWDARGRLTKIKLSNNQEVVYKYDTFKRLISRSAEGNTTTSLYDNLDVILDKNSSGSQIDYLNSEYIDEKLRQASSSTGSLYFIQDHLASTLALTTTNGNIAMRLQYTAFGDSSNSSLTRFTYTGREQDLLTGLLYYRSRWYDPKQGRFITEDPIGFKGSINFYSYTGNNPVLFSDPYGFEDPYGRRLIEGDVGSLYCFNSAEEAAIDIIQSINPLSKKLNREFCGSVCCLDGCFFATIPSRGTIASCTANIECFLFGATTEAQYHTHGGKDNRFINEEFSDADQEKAYDTGVPEYVGTPNGDIRRYTPPPKNPNKKFKPKYSTPGDVVCKSCASGEIRSK